MRELVDRIPAALAASGTVWLALGLTAAWLRRRRPARAHSMLALAAAGALVTPLLVAVVHGANWGVLPAASANSPAPAGRPAEIAAPKPRELHLIPPPLIVRYAESPARHDVSVSPSPSATPIFARGLSWRAVTCQVWAVLSAAFACRFLVDVVTGWRTVLRSRPATDAALVQALNDDAMRIGVAHPYPRLRASSTVASPALWGWSRPATVVIPEVVTFSGNYEAVFCHELAHLGRHDHWTVLLAELVVCVLPWHPFAWLTRRWLCARAEEACDDWAVAYGCPPLDYAEALVGLAPTATPALTVAAVSRRSPLATRVRRLLAGSLRPPRLGRGWLAGATLSAVLLAAASALWQPRHAVANRLADDPPKPAAPPASARPDSARAMRVVVLDPRGKPVSDAKVLASIWSDDKDFKATRDYKTDSAGAAQVELPKTFSILRLWVHKKPFVSMFAAWEKDELASSRGVPAEYTFRLGSPLVAGGRILDEQGKPIAGAKIQVRLGFDNHAKPADSDGRMSYNAWLAEGSDAATTDAAGRWRIDNVPDHPQVER